MRNFKKERAVGFLLFFLGVSLFFVFLVIPYSRLIGKKQLDFPIDPDLVRESPSPFPVLPIYTGLKGTGVSRSLNYYLTIKKLGIKKAPIATNVVVDNLRPSYLNSLINSLGHLSGTSLPGQRGNSVIFGHSAIPYLYNSRDFRTIFTKLDELVFGDVIEIEVEGQSLKYRVEKGGLVGKKTTISDFSSAKPRLTLLSCYPPGFKSEKYAVRALLIN